MKFKRVLILICLLLLIGIVPCLIWRDPLLAVSAKHGSNCGTHFLLWIGANVNARDPENGGTPLFWAAGFAHPDVTHTLLDAGADATITDDRGVSALCYSLHSGKLESVEVTKLLLEAGALQGLKYPFGCIGHSNTSAQHITALLDHGVDPSLTMPSGETPVLSYTCAGDLKDIIKLLVDRGGVFDAPDNRGRTALTEAVRFGRLDTVRYLVELGADTTRKVNGLSLVELARVERDSFPPSAISYPRHVDLVKYLEEIEAARLADNARE